MFIPSIFSSPAGASLQLVPNSQFTILSPSYLSHKSYNSQFPAAFVLLYKIAIVIVFKRPTMPFFLAAHILLLCARAALSLFIFCIEEVACLVALAPLLATVAKGSVLKSSTISLSHKIIFEIFCGVFCYLLIVRGL